MAYHTINTQCTAEKLHFSSSQMCNSLHKQVHRHQYWPISFADCFRYFIFLVKTDQEKINKKENPSFFRRSNLSTCWTTTVNVDQDRREFVPLQKRERCSYQCTLNVKHSTQSSLLSTEVQQRLYCIIDFTIVDFRIGAQIFRAFTSKA